MTPEKLKELFTALGLTFVGNHVDGFTLMKTHRTATDGRNEIICNFKSFEAARAFHAGMIFGAKLARTPQKAESA